MCWFCWSLATCTTCLPRPCFAEMSSKVLQADLEVLRKDILKYKTDLYSLRDKLERLATEYQDSKQHNPTQRYNVLKDLIKTATADVKE